MSVSLVRILIDYLDKRGIEIKNILTEIILELYNKYCLEKDCTDLIAAKQFMELFDELRLQREQQHSIFDKVLEEYIWYADMKAISSEKVVENVIANKVQIRRLLGRWNPKSHSMPIEKVVEDVMTKVNEKQVGSYNYWTEQRVGKERRKFEYKLVINRDEALFYDCYNACVYRLEGRGENR